jgi:hypothetical protein
VAAPIGRSGRSDCGHLVKRVTPPHELDRPQDVVLADVAAELPLDRFGRNLSYIGKYVFHARCARYCRS